MRDAVEKRKRKNKYKANQVVVDGIVFDSIIESRYYAILQDKKRIGLILDFELQPKFVLLPPFESHGKKHKAITYTADFKVIHLDGSVEIIDIKGFEPRDFPLRRKMFDYRNPDLFLKVLADCPAIYAEHAIDPGFIDFDLLKKLRAASKRAKGAASVEKEKAKQATTRQKKSRASRDIRARV